MSSERSRVLALVVAGIVSMAGTPHAIANTTYNFDRVVVWGVSSGWTSSTWSGGGGFWGGSSSTTEDRTQQILTVCDDLWGTSPSDCNVWQPPALIANGCTGSPDHLIVNGLPASSLGAIFTSACNQHDICYGSFLASKSACDVNLQEDMIRTAQEQIPSSQWTYYEPHVRTQAYAFVLFLSTDFISMGKYETAQNEGSCRVHSELMAEYQCI